MTNKKERDEDLALVVDFALRAGHATDEVKEAAGRLQAENDK